MTDADLGQYETCPGAVRGRRFSTGGRRAIAALTAGCALAFGVATVGSAHADDDVPTRTVSIHVEQDGGFVGRFCVAVFPGEVDGEFLPAITGCTDEMPVGTSGDLVFNDIPVGDRSSVRVRSNVLIFKDFQINESKQTLEGSDDFEACHRLTGVIGNERYEEC